MAKTIVIGGGISALTYLLYNPGAVALVGDTAGVGGMFRTKPNYGPQYLWADKWTQRLLKDLHLCDHTHLIRVGVMDGRRVYKPEDALQPMAMENYASKTRGIGCSTRASFMSGGKRTYEVYYTSPAEVVDAIMCEVEKQLLFTSALEVNCKKKIVMGGNLMTYEYGKLVSTIPAPVFSLIAGLKDRSKLCGINKYYAVQHLSKCDLAVRRAMREGLHYLYCPKMDVPWHRITFWNDNAIFEYTLSEPSPQKFTEVYTQFNGQIISGAEILKQVPKNVEFLGRYAQWDHSIKYNNVVQKIMEGK